jgi:pSer/pThr/pTyr-binding forkhead associated (FHA) protein
VTPSPLDRGVAAPAELREQIHAERRGTPFLLYRDGGDRQVILELGDDRQRVTVGRRPTSDVPLGWDTEVSRLHAEIERLGTSWVLCDEGLSHNGTHVNGERVHGRRRLRDGDVLAIGDTLIAYCAPGEEATGTEPTRTAQHARSAVEVSPAQRRVLTALCRPYRESGYAAPASNRQIADELVVTIDTVKGTLRQLFEAFGVQELPQNQKRSALAMRALQSGVVNRRDL